MSNDNADISVSICLPDHIIAACKQIHITSSHNPNKYVIQIIDSNGNKKYVLPCATSHGAIIRRTPWCTPKL